MLPKKITPVTVMEIGLGITVGAYAAFAGLVLFLLGWGIIDWAWVK